MTTTAPTPAPASAPGRAAGAPGAAPRRAEGIELCGEYEDSGFKVAPWLVRRGDGQTLQLSHLLYLVAEAADGERGYDAIAEQVSDRFGKRVSADNVSHLVDSRLRPLGVVTRADGSQPKTGPRKKQLLALNLRTGVIPPGTVDALTRVFRPLFLPPVLLAAVGGLAAADAWLFGMHGVAQSMRSVINQPVLLLGVLCLVIISAALHECGHATGLRYGGGHPGVMGVGLYIVWPAFYTDVTDSYRLSKGARLRTDLGGVYMNAVFMLVLFGVYALTHVEMLLAVVALLHIEVLHQFLPFLRLDGYYLVSDLVGVPDLFARLRPTLTSLLPWKPTEKSVDELKPWVRAAVTAWVVLTIPVLLYVYTMMIVHAPQVMATAWQSLTHQGSQAVTSFGHGSIGPGLLAAVQVLALGLPAVGLVYTLARTIGRVGLGTWRRTEGRPVLRGAFTTACAAGAVLLALSWLPRGNYRPIGPGDRGTVEAGFRSVSPVVHHGLTPAQWDQPATTPEPSPGTSPSPSPGASPSPSPDASPSPFATPAARLRGGGAVVTPRPQAASPAPTATAAPSASASPTTVPTADPTATPTPTPSPTP
ncbi:MAG TPA: hypothetical protein VH134_09435 [Candidatus Dormibacteraeota bacterium]|nr:hypothetical protein [Candidatus Dormibacteraeota bacterium]